MNLLRALATISGMTLISRILGFVRDAVIARLFGAGLYTDAFFVAFRIPNLLRRLFAEGAFAQAFVPVLAEYKTREGEAQTRRLVDRTATMLSVALVAVTSLGIAVAPLIVYVGAPGFAAEPAKFDVTVSLLRVTFPYIIFNFRRSRPSACCPGPAWSTTIRACGAFSCSWRRQWWAYRWARSACSSTPFSPRFSSRAASPGCITRTV